MPPPRQPVKRILALHSADGKAGDKVLLEEGVDTGDGDGHHEGDGHADALLRHGGPQGAAVAQQGGGVFGQEVQAALHPVQHGLQGEQMVAGDVQLGLEPVVPVAEGQEQADGGQHGLGDGHHDLEEDGPLGGAVDAGGLNDLVGDRVAEEGPGDGDVEAGHRQGQDQGPDGVCQVEDLGVDHVGGRHAAAEDHGDKDQDGQEVVELVLTAGQDVAHDGGQQYAQDGADGG